jgi:hypothetical protein
MLASQICIFFAFFSALLVIYSPVYFFDYLFHDDVYFWLKEPWAPYHYQHTMLINMGRPLAAMLADVENFFIHTVHDLQYLRIMAVGIFAYCAFICFGHFERWLKNDLQAWCMSVAVFCLPPFEDVIFYAVGWFFSLGVLMVCLAAGMAQTRWLLGVGLFFASLLIYPPAAMFFWVLVVISILAGDKAYPRMISLAAAGLVLYGLWLKCSQWFMLMYAPADNRLYNPFHIETDWFAKLQWFAQEPVQNALNLWNIFSNTATALLVCCLVLAAILVTNWTREKMFRALICAAIFILAFLPGLAAQGKAPYYRCLIGLMPIVLVILIWSLKKFSQLLPLPGRQKVLTVFLMVMLLGGGFVAFNNVLFHRVLLSHKEWLFFKSMAQTVRFRADDLLIIALPNHLDLKERYDEFGVWTSHYKLDILLLIKCAFQQAGVLQWPEIWVVPPGHKTLLRMEGYMYRVYPDGRQTTQAVGHPDQIYREEDLHLKYDPRFDRGFNFTISTVRLPARARGIAVLDVRQFHENEMK